MNEDKSHSLNAQTIVIYSQGDDSTIKRCSQKLADGLLTQKEELIWSVIFDRLGEYQYLNLIKPLVTCEIDDQSGNEIWYLEEEPVIFLKRAVSKLEGSVMKASIYYYIYTVGEEAEHADNNETIN